MTVFQSRKKRFVQAGALAPTAALITGVAAQGPRIAGKPRSIQARRAMPGPVS